MNQKSEESARARLIPVDAVGAMLNLSGRQVYRLADAGKMPRPIKVGGAVRWDRRVIERWIDNGCPPVSSRQLAVSH